MNIKKSFKRKVAVISMLGALGISVGQKVEADLIDKLCKLGGITGLIHTVWTIGTGQDLIKWFMRKIDKPYGIWPNKRLSESRPQQNKPNEIKPGNPATTPLQTQNIRIR